MNAPPVAPVEIAEYVKTYAQNQRLTELKRKRITPMKWMEKDALPAGFVPVPVPVVYGTSRHITIRYNCKFGQK